MPSNRTNKMIKRTKKSVAKNKELCSNEGSFRQVKLQTLNKPKVRKVRHKDIVDNNKSLYEYVKPRYGVKHKRKYFKVYDRT